MNAYAIAHLHSVRVGPDIVQYLPSAATQSMVSGVTQGGDDSAKPLVWWAGALVLAAYAAVLAGFGSWRTVRSDIS